jgi:hypothetical protein
MNEQPIITPASQIQPETPTTVEGVRTMTYWEPSPEIRRIHDAVVRKTILERREQRQREA